MEVDMQRGFIIVLAGLLLFGATSAADERDVARTVDGFRALNPGLESYAPMHEEWVPAMGIHWGVPGPHLTLGVADDTVVVVEAIYPEAIGWQPWFDQPEGEPMELEGFGMAYTQHIWIAEPASVAPGQEPTMVPLTLEALTAVNPALEQYGRLSDEYVPQMGYHYGVMGPGLVLAVSEEGGVNAFELLFPAEQGWYPWFDQPEGQPMELPGLGEVYSQHVYVVDPATLP
jgi:hypothetical protein